MPVSSTNSVVTDKAVEVQPALSSQTDARPVEKPKQRCPICSEDIDGTRLVLACQDCGTLHHVDCWLFNGGCAIFACNSIHAEDYWETQLAGDCNAVVESGYGFVAWMLALPISLMLFAPIVQFTYGLLSETNHGFAMLLLPLFFILLWEMVSGFTAAYNAFVYARIVFDPKSQKASRQWFAFGYPISAEDEEWLGRKKVVEVHVHFPLSLGPGKDEIHLAFGDGTRYSLYEAEYSWSTQKLPRLDILRLAENIAATFDCSVRIMRSLRAPTKQEIVVLAANRDMGFAKGQLLEQLNTSQKTLTIVKDKCTDEDKFKLRKRVEVKDCKACGNSLAIDVVECKRCSALFHNSCWEKAAVCPMQNCSGRVADKPQGDKFDLEQEYVNFVFSPIVEDGDAYTRIGWQLVYIIVLAFGYLMLSTHNFAWFLGVTLWLAIIRYPLAGDITLETRSTMFFDEDQQKVFERPNTIPISRENIVFSASDIIEVHHHWYASSLEVREELYLLLRDGSRRQLMSIRAERQSSLLTRAPEYQADYVAEKMARYAKCPIRFVRGEKPPPLPAGFVG